MPRFEIFFFPRELTFFIIIMNATASEWAFLSRLNRQINKNTRRPRENGNTETTTYWFLTGIWSCGTPFAVYENTAGLIFCSKSIFICSREIFSSFLFSPLMRFSPVYFVSFSISFNMWALVVPCYRTLHKDWTQIITKYLFRELMSDFFHETIPFC